MMCENINQLETHVLISMETNIIIQAPEMETNLKGLDGNKFKEFKFWKKIAVILLLKLPKKC